MSRPVPVHQAVDVVEDRGVAPLVPALGAEATTPVQDVLLVDVPFTALAASGDVSYPVLAVGTSEKWHLVNFKNLHLQNKLLTRPPIIKYRTSETCLRND